MKLNIVAVMCSKKKMERYKSLKEKYSELSNENLKYEVINSSANTKKCQNFYRG